MIVKTRTESRELKIYRSLNTRIKLNDNQKRYLYNLEKGYQGEVIFDQLTANKLQAEMLIVNDLLLEYNNTHFQIDSLMITRSKIYLIDVKNYEWEYLFKDGKFYLASNKNSQALNPLNQLNRAETLLSNFLQYLGFNIPIESFLVFVNPNFTLFHAPQTKTIVLPTQLNSFYNKLNMNSSRTDETSGNIAEKLMALHITDPPIAKLPTYSFNEVKKVITCSNCDSLSISAGLYKITCNDCECEEMNESVILRKVEEFRLLFPNEKITTNRIYEWCGGMKNRKSISRVLERNLKRFGNLRWVYYE